MRLAGLAIQGSSPCPKESLTPGRTVRTWGLDAGDICCSHGTCCAVGARLAKEHQITCCVRKQGSIGIIGSSHAGQGHHLLIDDTREPDVPVAVSTEVEEAFVLAGGQQAFCIQHREICITQESICLLKRIQLRGSTCGGSFSRVHGGLVGAISMKKSTVCMDKLSGST